jgi:alanine racemase
MSPMREAHIDLSAISANVELIRETVEADALVVVKANGYGHGAVQSATAARDGGATWLGVVDLDEAMQLRTAGITTPILAWLHDPHTDFAVAVENGIDIGVSYLDQLERVASSGTGATVQFKVDTGLGRNGVELSEWAAVCERAAQLQRAGSIRVRGIFSHLANAGESADSEQLARFTDAIAIAHSAGLEPELLHLAATEGALQNEAARFGLVRIGIGAYGLSPFAGEPGIPLRPAMELRATIAAVKRVPAGSGVSYNHTYVTEAETTLALVPLGYGDGIPRHASNAAPVVINGSRYRVCGRVAMDQFVVDVGDSAVAVGDTAILFGDPATGVPSADDWAAAAQTINYEIVTRIGNRVIRTYS